MNKMGFCGRCWNYVDFCDCINYEYDLEFENEKIIPPPPEDPAPEVGTVWYFMAPIAPLAYGLEVANADKLGLGILLNQENLWTINPPPGDPSLYLSIPVDRLPFVSIPDGLGSQYKQLQPWELNYFNFNLSLFDKVKTLAQDLAQCKQKWKPLATACKIVKGIANFFQEWNADEIPIPDGLLDELSRIDEYLDPSILIGIILSYFPPEIVEELNNSVLTAIDYDWVHRHLVDTLDPDLGYEDKKQEYGNAFEQGDLFNTDGSYPFPKPSESILQGGGTVGQNQATERVGPDRQMTRFPLPVYRPRPIFDDVIPYDSDDDNGPASTTKNPFINPPAANTVALTSLPGTLVNNLAAAAVLRYPCMFQVLVNPGINQNQFVGYPCSEITIVSPTVVTTQFISQSSTGYTLFHFVAANSGGGSLANRNFRFTKVSGLDTQIDISITGIGPGVILTETSNVIEITGLQFNNLTAGSPSLMYSKLYMKGVLSSNTIWNVEQIGGAGQNGNFSANWTSAAVLDPMNTVLLTPAPLPTFTVEGYLTQFGLTAGVVYEGKTITCDPRFQIPIMLQVRNEINMIAYAPNTFITAGSPGYVVGRSGGVGGIGSPYLPFDPIGRTTPVTYKLSIQKSQGQSFIIGVLSYSL